MCGSCISCISNGHNMRVEKQKVTQPDKSVSQNKGWKYTKYSRDTWDKQTWMSISFAHIMAVWS